MIKDSLGDRMKRYEDVHRLKLMPRAPKIIRIDGKAFHTYLKHAKKPYDSSVMARLNLTAIRLMKEIGGTARFAYLQSDECSIVLNDALTHETQAWFDNNVQKIASVAASIYSVTFNQLVAIGPELKELLPDAAYFDARVFAVPDPSEMVNYFVWRQQDAIRNSIQQYGRAKYSAKELHGKSCVEIKAMLEASKSKWENEPAWTRNGVVIDASGNGTNIDSDVPLFQTNRAYLLDKFYPKEEEVEDTVGEKIGVYQ